MHLTICSLRIKWSRRITLTSEEKLLPEARDPALRICRFNQLWKRYESIGINEKVLPQPLRDSSDPHRFSRLIVWGASKPIRILAQKYFFISPNTNG